MDNSLSQTEELLALKSIYDDSVFRVDDQQPLSGRLIVNVQLPVPFYIIYDSSELDCEIDKFQVHHLLPIELFFELPSTYPSNSCPAFLLSCPWLSLQQLSKLCKKLEGMWIEGKGEVILFSWIYFLQEEVLRYLGIINFLSIPPKLNCNIQECTTNMQERVLSNSDNKSENSLNHQTILKNEVVDDIHAPLSNENINLCEDSSSSGNIKQYSQCNTKPSVKGGSGCVDCRAFSDRLNSYIIILKLKEYDHYKKQEIFSQSVMTCEICYLDKRGYDFHTFDKCNHTCCNECLKSYFEIQIKSGNVQSLACPHGNCSSIADGTLVRSIVDKELFEKYDNVLLARTLENMSDIAYCPRKACQTPVLLEMESKVGVCPMCQFAFCVFCRMAYHGVAPCNLKTEEKRAICKKYLNGEKSEKAEMEHRYGKKELQVLVNNMLSEEWVDSNSKECPHCSCKIEKNDGCNKMTCFRCGTYFCWLCMVEIQSSNPYSHFSSRTSSCYNMLFPENYEFVYPGEYLEI